MQDKTIEQNIRLPHQSICLLKTADSSFGETIFFKKRSLSHALHLALDRKLCISVCAFNIV
jgi:hypothetical protein